MDNKYGKIIQKKRKECNLTQEELGQKLGLSANCISAWELGRNEPNMGNVIKMSKIFNCSIQELMGYEPSLQEIVIQTDDMKEPLILTIPNSGTNSLSRLLKIIKKLNESQIKKLTDYAVDILTED